MSDKKALILEYLSRNLVLNRELIAEIQNKLPSLTDSQIDQIGQILFKLDQEQTEALTKKLQQEPYFFRKLESLILKTMSDKFSHSEQAEHKAADEALLQDLDQLVT